jgi:hypothetical protein
VAVGCIAAKYRGMMNANFKLNSGGTTQVFLYTINLVICFGQVCMCGTQPGEVSSAATTKIDA